MGKQGGPNVSFTQAPKVPLKVRLLGYLLRIINYFVYRKDGTVNRSLQRRMEIKVRANPQPVNGIYTKDIVIDAANDVWVRSCVPSQQQGENDTTTAELLQAQFNEKTPIIVFFHGGGFIGLCPDLATYDKFCRDLARSSNSVVLSVNYRKAPEFPYPAAYEDSFKVVQWLRSPEATTELPPTADVSRCFLMGDSAGANIAHFVGCQASQQDVSPIQIRALVLLQPFFGGEEITPAEKMPDQLILNLDAAHWAWRAFLPKGSNRDHHACNVFGPNSPDISGLSLPPILVVTGTLDILKDWQDRYVRKLEEFGKDVRVLVYLGGFHGFYIIESKIGQTAMTDVYDFIRSMS